VIVVTGANKGIGMEIVKQLAAQAHEVILTARDATKGAKACAQVNREHPAVHFVPLDITQDAQIKNAVAQIQSTFGKVDVLINNAAILLREDQSLLSDEPAIFEKTLHTNAFAQLRVTQQFYPLLPAGGRIIMTSSGGGSMSSPVGGWSPAYCVSKSLLGAITRHLAHELGPRKITVNAFDPGWVKTDMGGHSAPREVGEGAATAVWLATGPVVETGLFFRDKKSIPW